MTTPRLEPTPTESIPGSVAPASEADGLLSRVLADSPRLLTGGHVALRRAVLEVAIAGLRAADPAAATRRVVSYDASIDVVTVDGRDYPLGRVGRVLVVGAGKASYPIAVALEEILGARLAGGVVAVRDPEAAPLARVTIMCADHPLPTERSVQAAQAILACVADAGPDDLVLTCFTGGSSALSSLPPDGVAVEDKRVLHQQLLSSGLAITDINVVRKQVSAVKGGRVALAALPARVVNLTVSDVAGSPLDTITDPTVQDTSDAASARAVLQQAELWNLVPASIRDHLDRSTPTPQLAKEPQTVMLADGASTAAAMGQAAAQLGFEPVLADREIEGHADEVGEYLARRAVGEAASHDRPVMFLGCGGEAVVTVTDDAEFGQGGPNQHAALRAAEVLAGRPSAALFVDTDGSDGGTVYAGALVDGETAQLARKCGVDLAQARADQRSTAVCEQLDLAVRTGHTGTNVNDLFVLLAMPEVDA